MQKNRPHLLAGAALALAVTSLAACAASAPGADGAGNSAAATDLAPFPATLPDAQRYVIELPARAQEDDYQLELIAGKNMTVDCNQQRLNGRFEERTVAGWGYAYWVFKSDGHAMSTLMACPPGSEKPGFVTGAPEHVRYNSKLPVVVFVPGDMQLRYRIWQAGPLEQASAR